MKKKYLKITKKNCKNLRKIRTKNLWALNIPSGTRKNHWMNNTFLFALYPDKYFGLPDSFVFEYSAVELAR